MPRTPKASAPVAPAPSNVIRLSPERIAAHRAKLAADPEVPAPASASAAPVIAQEPVKPQESPSVPAAELVLHGRRGSEQYEDYESLLRGMHETYKPVTAVEKQMVERLAAGWWKLSQLESQRDRIQEDLLAQGFDFAQALQRTNSMGVEAERIQNNLLRLGRDLIRTLEARERHG